MILLYRTLFVCLALLGAFILFKVIPVIAKMVTEKPVITLPLTQPSGNFTVTSEGDYSIWQKRTGLSRNRIEMGLPVVTQVSTGRKLTLGRTGGMITANDGTGTRRQLYTFSVPEQGKYRIEWPSDAAAENSEPGGSFPSIKTARVFSIEVRKPLPALKLIAGILGIVAGFAMLMGGIAGAALAERLL